MSDLTQSRTYYDIKKAEMNNDFHNQFADIYARLSTIEARIA